MFPVRASLSKPARVLALLLIMIIPRRFRRPPTTWKATVSLVCARLGLLSVRRHASRRRSEGSCDRIQIHPSHVRCQGQEVRCVWYSVPRRGLRRNVKAAATGTGCGLDRGTPPDIEPAVPNPFRLLIRCNRLSIGFWSRGVIESSGLRDFSGLSELSITSTVLSCLGIDDVNKVARGEPLATAPVIRLPPQPNTSCIISLVLVSVRL